MCALSIASRLLAAPTPRHTHWMNFSSSHFTLESASVFIRRWCMGNKLSRLRGWASPQCLPHNPLHRDRCIPRQSGKHTCHPRRVMRREGMASGEADSVSTCRTYAGFRRSMETVLAALCRQLKRAIQKETKALATASAVMSDRGSASGQRVYLSMAVRQYQKPDETGTAPTRSICTWEKRTDRRLKLPIAAFTCRVTLDGWQGVHAHVRAWQSIPNPGHTNRWHTNFMVALALGCLRLCRVSKTWCLKGMVTNGRGCGVDVSQ